MVRPSLGNYLQELDERESFHERSLLTLSVAEKSRATQVVSDAITEQEEYGDRLDQAVLKLKAYVVARAETDNAIAVVLSMKQYLKNKARSEHAFKQIDKLKILLHKVAAGAHLGKYRVMMDEILSEPMPDCVFGKNADVLQQAFLLCDNNNESSLDGGSCHSRSGGLSKRYSKCRYFQETPPSSLDLGAQQRRETSPAAA